MNINKSAITEKRSGSERDENKRVFNSVCVLSRSNTIDLSLLLIMMQPRRCRLSLLSA